MGTTGKLVLALACCGVAARASILFEGFEDITTLPGSGWVQINNSSSGGSTGWFQGDPTSTGFNAQAGSVNSYIEANFNNAAFGGDVSNWLITPTQTLDDGDVFSFYTRTELAAFPGDNLELRLSTNGGSTNVGTLPGDVGDFTTVLQQVGSSGYPEAWTLFQVTLSGLGGPTSGRLAFRYVVTDTANNGDLIGIDSVDLAAPVPEPSTAGLMLLSSIAGAAFYRRSRRTRA